MLRRDGRSYHSEWLGFGDAIDRLIADGILPNDIVYGVVEVHKRSAPNLRLVNLLDDGTVRNPIIGAWEKLNTQEGIICTTGYPLFFQGTANPLSVRIAWGNLRIEYVLEDTFAMSQLCWPVPDRGMRLPIDLKLCDEYLRAVASDTDDDEAEYGGFEDIDNINNRSLSAATNIYR